jgi:hypothetical protein
MVRLADGSDVPIVSIVIRPARRLVLPIALMTFVVGIAACRDVRQPPSNVLVPEVVGHWKSEAMDASGNVTMTLDSGQTMPVPDPGRDRFVLSTPGDRDASTLLMSGHEPNGRLWYVVLHADPNFPLPDDNGPCYGSSVVGAYDEGTSIVIMAPTQDRGPAFEFGIRLPKAPTMFTPFPSVAPWYGPRFGVCLDSQGRVASGDY